MISFLTTTLSAQKTERNFNVLIFVFLSFVLNPPNHNTADNRFLFSLLFKKDQALDCLSF